MLLKAFVQETVRPCFLASFQKSESETNIDRSTCQKAVGARGQSYQVLVKTSGGVSGYWMILWIN